MTCHPVRGRMLELGLEPGPLPCPTVMHLTQGLAPIGGVLSNSLNTAVLGPLYSAPACRRQLGHRLFVFHSLPLDRKSPPVTEVKVTSGKVGKEDRKGHPRKRSSLESETKKIKKEPSCHLGKRHVAHVLGLGLGLGKG